MAFSRRSTLIALAAIAALNTAAGFGQTPDQIEYFEKNVRPLLVANCQPCHNAKTKSSGLDLSSAAGLLAGGARGPAISKDHPETSHILTATRYDESLKMPPTGKLKPDQIEILENWGKFGFPWPGLQSGAVATSGPATPAKEFTPEQKAFWAFQPVKSPAVPKVKNQKWARTPIDNFILARLEEKSLHPAPPAARTTLLRRVTFDVTGLPPTEKEIADFLADNSPGAYEKVVDRLLASPRYGERWGRHWLDVARYADSTGNDEDHRYPYAWRYRDYVIDAFNHDMPYDQFVREQIAGDLLPARAPGNNGATFNDRGVVATGFLALGAKALAQVDKKKMLYDVWDEQVDVTSRAFLGLTLSCARCHDHKFDPLRTKDYYSLVGMFASTQSFEKSNQGVSGLLYRPLVPDEDYQAYRAAQVKIALQSLAIEELYDTQVLKAARESASHLADYMVAARQVYADGANPADAAAAKGLPVDMLNQFVKFLAPSKMSPEGLDEWRKAEPARLSQVAQAYQARYLAALEAWSKTIQKFQAARRKKLEAGELSQDRPQTNSKDVFFNAVYLFGGPFTIRDKDRDRDRFCSEEVKRQIAQLRVELDAARKSAPPEPAMADAIAEDTPVQQKVLLRGDYNNPGEDAPRAVPAVLTTAEPAPQSFHGSGRYELAEWLTRRENPLTARVMVNRIWMWHFGEGIVATPDNFGKMGARPTNPELLDYLATKFMQDGWSVKKLQRLILLSSAYQESTEADAKSAAADPENQFLTRFNRRRLEVEEIRDGMLAIDGTLDLTVGGTLQMGKGGDSENAATRLSMNPETVKRRTVYLPLRRSNLPTLLNLYDFGDATTVNGKRALTNVAPQALFMMNSEFVLERAKNIVKPHMTVDELYLKILNRKAKPEEVDAALTYIDRFKTKFHADDLTAFQSFAHILLTSNEFIYVD